MQIEHRVHILWMNFIVLLLLIVQDLLRMQYLQIISLVWHMTLTVSSKFKTERNKYVQQMIPCLGGTLAQTTQKDNVKACLGRALELK